MMDKTQLLGMMICPACQAKLLSLRQCDSCHALFTETDDIPAIFQTGVSRTIAFEFSPDRAVVGDGFRKSFHYPARGGASLGDSPYHLDMAHKDVIAALPAGSTILEIGCGGGQMREHVQSKGPRYVGIDISKSRVGDDLQRGGPDVLCDAYFLPFADQSFDMVYSAAVTEHLARPYLVAQEIFRALKPGGKYLGNVSCVESDRLDCDPPAGSWSNSDRICRHV